MLRLKKHRKREKHLSWNDFKHARFTESHSSRLDATKLSAHTMTNFQMKIIHTCTPQKSIKEVKNSWVLAPNSQGTNGPIKQREDYTEATNIKERLYEKSEEARQKSPSQQTSTAWSESTVLKSEGAERVDPKTGWKWYLSTSSSRSFSSWWESSETWWKASKLFFVNSNCKVFRLQAMGIPL